MTAAELLINSQDLIESHGIVGMAMAPFRDGYGMRGTLNTINWASLDIQGVQFERPLKGECSEVVHQVDEANWTLEPYGLRLDVDEDVLRNCKNPDKKTKGILGRIRRDWWVKMEELILQIIDLSALAAGANTITNFPPVVQWSAGAGTSIMLDILNQCRLRGNATQGYMRPNCFAAGEEVFMQLQVAPELTNYLGGLLDVSAIQRSQFVDWLKSNGFQYVLVGRSPNWLTRKHAYGVFVDMPGQDLEESMDTIPIIHNPGGAGGAQDSDVEVEEYYKNPKCHSFSVQKWARVQAVYGISGVRWADCIA